MQAKSAAHGVCGCHAHPTPNRYRCTLSLYYSVLLSPKRNNNQTPLDTLKNPTWILLLRCVGNITPLHCQKPHCQHLCCRYCLVSIDASLAEKSNSPLWTWILTFLPKDACISCRPSNMNFVRSSVLHLRTGTEREMSRLHHCTIGLHGPPLHLWIMSQLLSAASEFSHVKYCAQLYPKTTWFWSRRGNAKLAIFNQDVSIYWKRYENVFNVE